MLFWSSFMDYFEHVAGLSVSSFFYFNSLSNTRAYCIIITVSVEHWSTTSLFYFSYLRAEIIGEKRTVWGMCVASCLYPSIASVFCFMRGNLCNPLLLKNVVVQFMLFSVVCVVWTSENRKWEKLWRVFFQKSNKLELTYIFFLTWLFAFFWHKYSSQ